MRLPQIHSIVLTIFVFMCSAPGLYAEPHLEGSLQGKPYLSRCFSSFSNQSKISGNRFASLLSEMSQDEIDVLEDSFAYIVDVLVDTGKLPGRMADEAPLRAAQVILENKEWKSVLTILRGIAEDRKPMLESRLESQPKKPGPQIDDAGSDAGSESMDVTESVHGLESARPLESVRSLESVHAVSKRSKNMKGMTAAAAVEAVKAPVAPVSPEAEINVFQENNVIDTYHQTAINSQQRRLRFYRRLMGKTKDADSQYISRSITKLEAHLRSRDFESAFNGQVGDFDFKDLYQQVEVGLIVYKQLEAKIDFLTAVLKEEGFEGAGTRKMNAQLLLEELHEQKDKARSEFLAAYPLYKGISTYLRRIVASEDKKIDCKAACLFYMRRMGIYSEAVTVSKSQAISLEEVFGEFVDIEAHRDGFDAMQARINRSGDNLDQEISSFFRIPDNYVESYTYKLQRQRRGFLSWVYSGQASTNLIDWTLKKIGLKYGASSVPILSWLFKGHQSDRARNEHFGDLFRISRLNMDIKYKIMALSNLSVENPHYLVSIWQEANLRALVYEMTDALEADENLMRIHELLYKNLKLAKRKAMSLGDVSTVHEPGIIAKWTRNLAIVTAVVGVLGYTALAGTEFIGNPDDLDFADRARQALRIDTLQNGARWAIEVFNQNTDASIEDINVMERMRETSQH